MHGVGACGHLRFILCFHLTVQVPNCRLPVKDFSIVCLQAVLLVNVIYFVWLCHLTLPMYSLVVHMGSDLEREALPAELRERLQLARTQYDQANPL